MKHGLANEAISALQELNSLEAIYYEMAKVHYNIKTSLEMIATDVNNEELKLKIYEELYNSIKVSKKNLQNTLIEIARTFNDIEEEVFVYYFIENKSVDEICNLVDRSRSRVNHFIANFKQILEEKLKEHD